MVLGYQNLKLEELYMSDKPETPGAPDKGNPAQPQQHPVPPPGLPKTRPPRDTDGRPRHPGREHA